MADHQVLVDLPADQRRSQLDRFVLHHRRRLTPPSLLMPATAAQSGQDILDLYLQTNCILIKSSATDYSQILITLIRTWFDALVRSKPKNMPCVATYVLESSMSMQPFK